MKIKRVFLAILTVFLIVQVILVASKIAENTALGNFLVSRLTNQPYCKDCNVILISLDTLSANHLPCYGYYRDTAPNLCAFAKENVMFTNMYANAHFTLPSHVSIFTGLYPNQHNVNIPNKDSLSVSIPFMPELFQKSGYLTYFYMNLGHPNLPVDRVYNRGINQLVEGDNPRTWIRGLDTLLNNNKNKQKTFLFLHTWWLGSPYTPENPKRSIFANKNVSFTKYPKNIKELNTCTRNFMEYFERSLKKDLDDNYWDNKHKIIYEAIYADLIKLKTFDNNNLTSLCKNKTYEEYIQRYLGTYPVDLVDRLNDKEVSYLKDAYDSKIKELDEYTNKVISFVMNSNLKNNTVIIITADHGEEFMEHGDYGHANNLYDTTLKVPLIMYIPGQKARVISELSQSVDILPTLLAIIGIPQNFRTSGVDLFNKVTSVFHDRYGFAYQIGIKSSKYVIRDKVWKMHYRKSGSSVIPLELYNIEKDPQEKNNLLFTNPETINRFIRQISK